MSTEMREWGISTPAGPAGGTAILPRMGGKSSQDRTRRKVNGGNGDAGNDRRLLRRQSGRGETFRRNLIDAGFVKPGGDVYVAAFIRFVNMLAPGYHTIDRHTVARWLDGDDNAVAAALVRVIQIPSVDVARMIHAACHWGGRRRT